MTAPLETLRVSHEGSWRDCAPSGERWHAMRGCPVFAPAHVWLCLPVLGCQLKHESFSAELN